MPKLSVIVPVFNVEQYLSECIDSILAQTMCDFELILIDDGSPDRCGEICEKYAQLDSRIIVIHQKNQGVSAARNAGLEIAKGEYIGFVDPDDLINKNFFHKLISVADLYDCDIACCDYLVFERSETIIDDTGTIDKKVIEFDRDGIITDLFSRPSKMKASVCNKIFRKSFVCDNAFEITLKYYEDMLFLLKCCSLCRKFTVCFILEELYYYRMNRHSATKKINPQILRITNEVYKNYIFPYINHYYPQQNRNAIAYYLDFYSVQIRDYKKSELSTVYKKKEIRKTKASLFCFMIKSYFMRKIDRHIFNRYLFETILKKR